MHKTKVITSLIISVVIISVLVFVFSKAEFHSVSSNGSSSSEIWVDDDQRYPAEATGTVDNPYRTIVKAISEANDGDTIIVLPGSYPGGITIDKSITLTTVNRNTTFITSSDIAPYVIDIQADSVSVSDFTFIDTTSTSHRKAVIHISSDVSDVSVVNNNITRSNNGYGVYFDGSYGAIVKNNNIDNSRGVFFDNAHGNSLYGNKISNTSSYYGLRFSSSNSNYIENNEIFLNYHGAYAMSSNDNVFDSNIVRNNTYKGFYISGGSGNVFTNNEVFGNGNSGIEVSGTYSEILYNHIHNNDININLDASYCTAAHNKINNASSYGLFTGIGTHDSKIYNNTFQDVEDGTQVHAMDRGQNIWFNGTIGNYWDDFYGPDPYNSSTLSSLDSSLFYYTKNGVRDEHPLGKYHEGPEISTPSPSHLEEGVSRHPTLQVKVVDPDPDIYKSRITVDFYYILNDTSYLIETADVSSGSNASIKFSSTSAGKNKVYSYGGLGYDYICVWYVVAKDDYSQTKSSEYIFSTLEVPFDNEPPVANAGGSYTGQILDKIEFDGSLSSDLDGEIQFYRWTFGDGTSITNVVSPTHEYTEPGEYTASLVVIDNDGASHTSSAKVTIEGQTNDPPVSNANGPYSAPLGTIITFSSSGSYDPDQNYGDTISYYWTFGDGTNSTETYPKHNYSKAGNYTVKLIVVDKSGLADTDTTYVLVMTSSSTDTPGFELVIMLIAILFILVMRKRKK